MKDDALAEVERRVGAGETIVDIARSMSVTPRTVRNWFAAAGRPSPAKKRMHSRRSRLDDVDWLTGALERGWSDTDIARETSSSRADVAAAMTRHRLRPGPEQAILDAFDAGAGIREIERNLGHARPFVRRVLTKHDRTWDPTPAPRPAELDDAAVLRRWHRTEQLPMTVIARRLGISDATVRKALDDHGIARATYRPIAHPRLADRRWLEHRYLDDHATMAEITAELGVAPVTVQRALRRFGLRRFPRRLIDDAEWLRIAHHTHDVPVSRIARWLNTTVIGVLAALRSHNIEVRPEPTARGAERLFDLEWLHRRWVEDRVSIEQIADQLDVTLLEVRDALRTAGISRNPTR